MHTVSFSLASQIHKQSIEKHNQRIEFVIVFIHQVGRSNLGYLTASKNAFHFERFFPEFSRLKILDSE